MLDSVQDVCDQDSTSSLGIRVLTFNDNNIELHWPKDWPWVVGGLLITKKDAYGEGISNLRIEFLSPKYISHSDLLMINIATDFLFAGAYAIYFIVLASIGVVYLFLLALYELHLHTSMMQLLKQKKFSEVGKNLSYKTKFDVPYGNDVLAEKARVSRPSGNEVVLVKDLGKYHNKTFVLKNMTFALEKGDSFGLIGVSGSGKSVAFKLISGVDRPSCGKLGFCGSYDSLYPRLTCRQNVIIIAGMLGYRGVRQKADKLIGFVGLRLHGGKYVADCSESQKRRITVALALMTRAQLIVMDEPTKGVDPARRDIWKLIRTTHLNDRILLFTSSSLEECEMLGSRYGVLYKGRFISTGTTDVLRGHHSRFCVLHMELTDVKRKQKIPMSETESLSVFFRKTQQLASFIPAKDIRLTQATYDDALITLSDKFSNLQKRASEKELKIHERDQY
ncbi:ABC transporter, ATP-binding protein [Necator americanus]|uniref:ABC transporter, ATP-binding protein n=1 Tax=Necator americanus TaxID=51031 RepID=W2SVU8_NECAM|nr:ABC transporter, ATP-binding protein [Necator americanus]ETN72817.1 ABC transporter, ATP-binding protein [Necator americanus]